MKQPFFRRLICLLLILAAERSYSFAGDEVEIDGTIKAFSTTDVEIKSNKVVYTVPRNLILLSDLKFEQEINVSISKEQFVALKRVPPVKK